MTLADLATSIDHQHLGGVIRSVAYRAGSLPEQTPAFAAVELYTARTFGRWQVEPLEIDAGLRRWAIFRPGRGPGSAPWASQGTRPP